MEGIGPCASCGSKNGVWHEASQKYLCASHWNIAAQAEAAAQGKRVYCLKCLGIQKEEAFKLINAGAGICPSCGGPGPLFWR